MKQWHRALPLVALALAAGNSVVGPASPATAAETPTAAVSDVTCVEGDGQVTTTLAASDTDAATFLVLVDGAGGDEIEVAAGATEDVVTSALEDGDHTVEAILLTEGDGETLALANRTVACDVAPDGPYSNPRGAVLDGCEGTGWVTASNKPIGGNAEDLQPVTFTISFTPTDDVAEEPTDGGGDDPVGGDGEEPVDEPVEERAAAGPEVELATFVLDATTQTYDRTFTAEELGSTGDLVLRVGEEVIASGHVGICVVLAVESGGGPPLVNTGA